MKIELEKDIKDILEILKSHGQGYIVGGYVRDKLMGRVPHDADFLTDISYDELNIIFKDYEPKEVGKHFGIIMIKYKGNWYEIAKMREDIGIPENRKLQDINFVEDIYIDLKRRDFTINAIAYDGKNLYYHPISMTDIKHSNLRFIGDTRQRIKEDPLRILRAFRFLATKDLYSCIEQKEISQNIDLLDTLSPQRIRDEFQKILLSSNLKVLKTMRDLNVLTKIFDGIEISDEIIDNLEKIENKFYPRLTYFFIATNYDIKKLKKYFYSKNLLRLIEDLKRCRDKFYPDIYKILQVIGAKNFKLLQNILSPEQNKVLTIKYNYIMDNNLPYSINDLKINIGMTIKNIMFQKIKLHRCFMPC